ncbi:MAG: hypothetical protein WDO19_23440 [Bacteroidota bacterium]
MIFASQFSNYSMGNNSGGNSFGDVLVGFLGILLAIPLFFIAHRQVPQFDLPYHLDRIALFILIVFLLLLVLRLFKTLLLSLLSPLRDGWGMDHLPVNTDLRICIVMPALSFILFKMIPMRKH